jgi:O-succinylbenzoic acid--CoA ligase
MLATCYLDGAPIAPAFTTADLGYLDGGALYIAGRSDDVIITGGENVHPTAVEIVVAATPGVRAACAFGVRDERWGQIIGAAVVVDPAFDVAAAADRWRAALPSHARPRRLAICTALPLLPSGKVDRRAAAALPATPVEYR